MSNIVTYEARFNTDDFTRGAQNIFTQVNQMNQVFNQTNTFIGSLGNKFKDSVLLFKNLTDVVNNVSGALSSIAAPGLEAGTQLRNMTTLFRGNGEEAKDMYDRIAQYGKDVKIYDKGTLLEAQKTMMSFGVDAEKSFGALKNIGDIAMGDGQKMQALSLAFAQATSTGKLMGQDLMQMINAGFNPLQVISERTGESMESLKDKMSKGEISADMLAQAFQWATDEQGQFYQGAENAGDTPAGKLAELRNKMDDLKTSMFEAAPELFTYATAAGEIGTQIAPLLPLFEGIGSGALSLVKKIGGKLLPAITANNVSLLAGGGLWKFFQKMGETACKGVSRAIMTIPIVGWIAAGITAIIGIVTLLWEKCEGFRVLVMGIWEVIKTGFMAVWEFIQPAIDWCRDMVMGIVDFFMSIPEKVMAVVGAIKTKVKEVYNWLKTTIFGPIVDWFKNLYKNTVKPVIDKIVGLMADLFAPIIELWNKVTGKIVRAWNKGAAKGHESWANDHEDKKEEEEKTENGGGIFQPVVTPTGKTPKTVKKNTESIATGGTRSTTVNITIGDMIKQCVFNGSVNENVDNVADKFAEALNRALGMAYATAKV